MKNGGEPEKVSNFDENIFIPSNEKLLHQVIFFAKIQKNSAHSSKSGTFLPASRTISYFRMTEQKLSSVSYFACTKHIFLNRF